jgi:hypothetical protein
VTVPRPADCRDVNPRKISVGAKDARGPHCSRGTQGRWWSWGSSAAFLANMQVERQRKH